MIQGIDVSKWQGEMDWAKAAEKVKFAYIRACSVDNTSGTCYEDSQFRRNSVEAPKYMPVGYYWYFKPNHDPIRQAQYFHALIDKPGYTFPPAADFEDHAGMKPDAVSEKQYVFMNELEKLSNIVPVIYTSPGFWNVRTTKPSWARVYYLWIAHWNVSKPTVPYPWNEFDVHQYRIEKEDGGKYGAQSKSIDLDYMTQEFWDTFIKPPTLEEEVTIIIGSKVFKGTGKWQSA